jgi:hypothetical protein
MNHKIASTQCSNAGRSFHLLSTFSVMANEGTRPTDNLRLRSYFAHRYDS